MISKIFHVSDIHIRNFQRHKEYRQVFENLFKYIRENKDEKSVIFLGGDIVHNKTDMSPELVDETSNFLRGCADILPTILIAGNHDQNLKSNRLDALSPIVDSLKHPNLHYWKSSGVYEFDGVSFSVFACQDSPDKWIMAKDFDAKIKIALHHGSVIGSYTAANHEMKTGINLDHFAGFDLAMLGDIHKFSFLNDEKTIAYSSSLICQDYGESVYGHGLIVWDVENKRGEFVEIQNDYAYVTFDLVNGKCKVPDNLPKNLRVRVRHENSTTEQVEDFIKKIGKKHFIVEVVKEKSSNSQMIDRQRTEVLGNSRKVDFQNKMISDFLSPIDDITSDEIKMVQQMNAEINRLLPVNNAHRDVTWKPLELEFSNMFSFGEENTIDFTDLIGSYGLFSKNAEGKSSLLDILSFVLYDKTTRATKASHIMNNSKNSFYCKLRFAINGIEYFVERIGTRKKDDNVKVEVNFWTTDESGNKLNLNGEDRDKTNFAIRNYVGTYDDFVLTALSTQYDNQNFVEKTQRDRKDLLYKFLDITVFDDLFKLAKEESRECQALIREYEREDLHSTSSKLYAQINESQSELDLIEGELVETKTLLKVESDKLLELNKSYHPISNELNISEIESSIEGIMRNIQYCMTDLENVGKQIEDKTEAVKVVKAMLKTFKNPINLNTAESEFREIESRFNLTQQKLERLKDQFEHCVKHEVLLSKHEYDPNCKFCVNNDFVKDARKSIDKIDSLKVQITELEISINSISIELQVASDKLLRSREHDNSVKKLQTLESELKLSKEQLKALKYKGKSIQESLKEAKKNRDQYNKNSAIIEKNVEVMSNISSTKVIINKYERLEKELQNKQRLKHSSIEGLKAKYEECNLKLDKYLKYLKKYRIYELYLQSVSREGVPYRILEGVLPVIENEVNSILSGLTSFSVRLEANDDKYIHAHIVYDPTKSWPVELSSGMERFILSLAFRTSLSEITSLPKANFIAIDEGFGVLDSDNLLSMGNLFTYLKGQYDFLICISHIDSMRDLVDKQIKIEKINGFSKINFKSNELFEANR